MLRRAMFAVLLFAGCDTTHLGDGYGKKTRTALDAQADQRAAEEHGAGALDSVDAQNTMDKQHATTGLGAGAAPGSGGMVPMIPMPTTSMGGSGYTSSGSVVNPIKLEGK